MARIVLLSRTASRWIAHSVCSAMLLPFAANAGCPQWNASGKWQMVQTNHTVVKLDLEQSASNLSGHAYYDYWENYWHTVYGPAVGTIRGDSFEITVYWDNNAVGIYKGEIGAQGLIVGTGYDAKAPQTRADWHSWQTMHCPPATGDPAPPSSPGIGAAVSNKSTMALGRVETPGVPGQAADICEVAKSARARNSPAAPSLEAQCRAQSAKADRPVLDEAWQIDHAARGEALANQDPLALELRLLEPEGARRRGFDYGMAMAEGQTADGPGKKSVHDALSADAQAGFESAVSYSLERNANASLAATGAVIAASDPEVSVARESGAAAIAKAAGVADAAIYYKLGFDIASGIFGDPALGALGNTAKGPGAVKIRDALTTGNEQTGFDDSVSYHLGRQYVH